MESIKSTLLIKVIMKSDYSLEFLWNDKIIMLARYDKLCKEALEMICEELKASLARMLKDPQEGEKDA